ncbi:hypothetical protein ACJIZ3_005128 [Penstemon smallii]|uniref:Uncharacterized protein n=1 Tax=Penstemon smallii TaxID=265156 RepID=A0ABD3S4C9_9LAMI
MQHIVLILKLFRIHVATLYRQRPPMKNLYRRLTATRQHFKRLCSSALFVMNSLYVDMILILNSFVYVNCSLLRNFAGYTSYITNKNTIITST